MSTALSVDRLSKRYLLQHEQQPYVALRDVLHQKVVGVARRFRGGGRPSDAERALDEFWALRDVSFDIKQGERIGIIGRNGAGKSTLLKLLSRITEPTSGRIRTKGRIASLLEVGTGFHPELTGRENIFLNGAILGMSRVEIRRKFDEIVAFAEVERFLDTPVKRYSSGMYVRLAFAVAAHLEPDVLIVDEVLSVGDAAFQRKCMGKMGEVAQEGRTVLFVSHNIGAISQLCTRGILLRKGRVIADADTATTVSTYLNSTETTEHTARFSTETVKNVQITFLAVVDTHGSPAGLHPHTEPFCVELEYQVSRWVPGSYVCLDIFNETDVRVVWSSDVESVDEMLMCREVGSYRSRVVVPGMVLPPGRHYFTAAVYSPGTSTLHDVREKAIAIDIVDGGSLLSNFGIRPHAATMVPLSWQTQRTARGIS